MLGDIILCIKRWIKQNILCVHEYEHHVHCMGDYDWYECKKCGKIK